MLRLQPRELGLLTFLKGEKRFSWAPSSRSQLHSHPSLGAAAATHAILVSTVKARQHGFADCIDTEDMLIEWLDEHRRRGALPP